MDMGLRGTPWDSWLMDILLSLFRFFRLTGGSGCHSNASGMHHRATQVQTRRFRRSSCSSSLPLCSRLRQRVKELEEKSCEELWRAVFAEICVMFFSPFFLCAWVFPLSSCTSGQMCWRHCRQINRFHFRVLFRNLACSRQLYRPPTIFTGEGCVLAERISHHRTSRDSILLQIAASDFAESVLHFLIIYDIHEILPPSCQEMRRPLPRQRKLCQNMQSPPDMRLSSQLPRSQSCG